MLPIGLGKPSKLPVKIVHKAYSLGTWYYNSVDDIIEENHKYRLEELEKILTRWKCRNLSLYGKATVIKSLATSKLNYTIASLATPQWFVDKAQSMIFEFLWDGKPPKIKNSVITNLVEKDHQKIKNSVITNLVENGGLRIPVIECIVKAQKAAWINRIIRNPNVAMTGHFEI